MRLSARGAFSHIGRALPMFVTPVPWLRTSALPKGLLMPCTMSSKTYWRPRRNSPKEACDRPRKTWRPKPRPPWAAVPLSAFRPDSSTALALRPPPRSSSTRMPQREPLRPLAVPSFMLVRLVPPAAEPPLVWVTFRSTRPYSVTLDWAWTLPSAANSAKGTRAFFIFFIFVSEGGFRPVVQGACRQGCAHTPCGTVRTGGVAMKGQGGGGSAAAGAYLNIPGSHSENMGT
ncbi:hypothetical protein D3C78_969950 [compost metagenome]